MFSNSQPGSARIHSWDEPVVFSAALASWPALAFTLLMFSLAHLWVSGRMLLTSLVTAVVALFLIYGSVWNMNYLLGALAYARRLDAIVLEWDLSAYQFLLGDDTTLEGLFPLVKNQALFRLTEGAYTMLFVQVFVVLFMLAELQRSPVRYLAVTLIVYLAAGVVFFLWPVVGPFIYPESLHVDFRASVTGDFGRMMAADYERMESRQASNGFGYIIGLPSLHVAMAVIMQWFLAASRIHFWAFLPVNFLLIAATFFLGFHYLVDVVAGFFHAALVLGGFHAWDMWKQRAAS